jgi:hypothetical protein
MLKASIKSHPHAARGPHPCSQLRRRGASSSQRSRSDTGYRCCGGDMTMLAALLLHSSAIAGAVAASVASPALQGRPPPGP